MSLGDRLLQFIESEGFKSNRSFEKKLDFTNGTINRVLNGTALGADKLAKLKQVFPGLNLNWLINGQGDMRLENGEHSAVEITREENERLKKEILELKDIVEVLKLAIRGKHKDE